MNRRKFLTLAGAGAFGVAHLEGGAQRDSGRAAPPLRGTPSLIVLNARVYTVDREAPRADAFAITAGRFSAVGASSDIRALARKETEIYDARGMTIVPGFVDTHNHAGGETLLYEVLVGNPFEVEFVTIESIVEKLRAKAQGLPPGTWVQGYFFDDTKLKDERSLTRHDLDRVSREHPVVVRHRGGHTSFYNGWALDNAGVRRNTPDPPGGTFERGPDGEPTGRVTDRATAVFNRIGRRPTFDDAEREQRARSGLAHISRQFVRYGLTSVHHQGGDLKIIQAARADGTLLHRVSYESSGRVLDSLIAAGIQTGFGDEWIKFGATSEHIADGSFSERTMAMSVPYPGTTYKGNVTETQEELNAWVERVHRAGIQVNCHANGDVAIDSYLTALERAQKVFPRPAARPKITHCTLINEGLVRRIKALDAVPAMFTTYAYYNSDKFAFYGEELMKRAMAYRSLLDAGVHATAGSDFAPGPFAPLMGIQGMVTRKGWDGKTWGVNQRITVEEAIRVNTYNGAYASHEEHIKGSISPGKLADFVVLAEDPHTADPERIKDITIVKTVVGGATVYNA